MIYSVESAKEKWCPFAQVSLEGRSTGNRYPSDEIVDGSKCLSEECMMWIMLGDGSTIANGYCGLARIPEEAIEAYTS